MLNKIFSVKTLYSRGELTQKIITIFGIKIKYVDTKAELKKQAYITNKNLLEITLNILEHSSHEDLFCLHNDCVSYIFNNKVRLLDKKFIYSYILPYGYETKLLELTKIEKETDLYKECLSKTKNGEFLWKSADRFYKIEHKFLSFENNELYINSVKDDGAVIKTKYIDGMTIEKYIENMSDKEKIRFLKEMFDFLFKEYKAEDNKDKVSVLLSDCHLNNIMIDKDKKIHYIDFDDRFKTSLDREFCIYYALYNHNRNLYNKILKIYGYKDKHLEYEKKFSIKKIQKIEEKHMDVKKYNTERKQYLIL